MNVFLFLSLWVALMMLSCCVANAGSPEEATTVADYDTDYPTETPTPEYDYDYTATFDYYILTGTYNPFTINKASGIGRLSPVLLLGLAVYHIWN